MSLKRWGMLLFGVGILTAFVLVALPGTELTAASTAVECAEGTTHDPTFLGVGPQGFQFTDGCNVITYAHPALWGVLLAAVGVLLGSAGVVREFTGSA